MPKEIPATTLIFDSIVDVTRKKQPCRVGKRAHGSHSYHRPGAQTSTSPDHQQLQGEMLPCRGLLAATLTPDLSKVISLPALHQAPSQPSCLIAEALSSGCSPWERWVEQGDSWEECSLHHRPVPAR